MEAFDDPHEQAQAIPEAMEEAGLHVGEVRVRYFSFSGIAGEYDVDAYLNGSLDLPGQERDLLSHAVNERVDELPPRRKAPTPTTKPSPALNATQQSRTTPEETRHEPPGTRDVSGRVH